MADNFQLLNTKIAIIRMRGHDAAGDVVDLDPSTVLHVTSSDPSVNAVINGIDLRLNATKRLSQNVTIEVDDDGPLVAFRMVVDVVNDLTPTSVFADFAAVTFEDQPIPAEDAPVPTPEPPTPTPTPEPPTPTPEPPLVLPTPTPVDPNLPTDTGTVPAVDPNAPVVPVDPNAPVPTDPASIARRGG